MSRLLDERDVNHAMEGILHDLLDRLKANELKCFELVESLEGSDDLMQPHDLEETVWSQVKMHVTLTYAQGMDGSISLPSRESLALSNDASRRLTHRLRASHEMILVGIGTVLADDPSLTTRYAPGRSPLPVVIDPSLKCPVHSKLVQRAHDEPVGGKLIIMATKDGLEDGPSEDKEKKRRKEALEKHGVFVDTCCPSSIVNGKPVISMLDVVERLKHFGRYSIMIEGGARVITDCLLTQLKTPFIDDVIVTIAPKWIGGFNGVQTPLGSNREVGGFQCPTLHQVNTCQLGNDIIVHGRF